MDASRVKGDRTRVVKYAEQGRGALTAELGYLSKGE
jgi:hypothetical protein